MKIAWDRGDTVFPHSPAEHGQRWFLRTPINPDKEENLVFIGINPSTAVNFAKNNKALGGDPTTGNILKFFPADTNGSPRHYRSLTIVNLIPLIGQSEKSRSQSAKKLPKWDKREGNPEIRDTYEITEQILDIIIPTSDILHLMWGNPNDDKFPWKREALGVVTKRLSNLVSDQTVTAFLNEASYPVHSNFGSKSHWEGKILVKSVDYLLKRDY